MPAQADSLPTDSVDYRLRRAGCSRFRVYALPPGFELLVSDADRVGLCHRHYCLGHTASRADFFARLSGVAVMIIGEFLVSCAVCRESCAIAEASNHPVDRDSRGWTGRYD